VIFFVEGEDGCVWHARLLFVLDLLLAFVEEEELESKGAWLVGGFEFGGDGDAGGRRARWVLGSAGSGRSRVYGVLRLRICGKRQCAGAIALVVGMAGLRFVRTLRGVRWARRR
jgi:hypothetical protein